MTWNHVYTPSDAGKEVLAVCGSVTSTSDDAVANRQSTGRNPTLARHKERMVPRCRDMLQNLTGFGVRQCHGQHTVHLQRPGTNNTLVLGLPRLLVAAGDNITGLDLLDRAWSELAGTGRDDAHWFLAGRDDGIFNRIAAFKRSNPDVSVMAL